MFIYFINFISKSNHVLMVNDKYKQILMFSRERSIEVDVDEHVLRGAKQKCFAGNRIEKLFSSS